MKLLDWNLAAACIIIATIWVCTIARKGPQAEGAQVNPTFAVVEDELVLADSVSVHWDHVHVFRPYDSAKFINESLGFHWPQSEEVGLEYSEGYNVMVFVRDKRVVAWAKIPCDQFEFRLGSPGAALVRGDAVFVTEPRPGQATILRLKGVPAEKR